MTIDQNSLAKLEQIYGDLTAAQIESLIEKGEVIEYIKDGVIYYTANEKRDDPTSRKPGNPGGGATRENTMW